MSLPWPAWTTEEWEERLAEPRSLGEGSGHPFRGNQWTSGNPVIKREAGVARKQLANATRENTRNVKWNEKELRQFKSEFGSRPILAQELFKAWGAKDAAGYEKNVNAALAELTAQAKPFIRMNAGDLAVVLSDGEVRNAFETGKTHGGTEVGGGFPDSRRRHGEELLFGIPKNAPGSDRPKYGYLSSGDGISELPAKRLKGAGGVAVQFKKHVKENTTFTIGDSLDPTVSLIPEGLGGGFEMNDIQFVPQPVNRPTLLAVPGGVLEHPWDEETGKIRKLTRIEQLAPDDYVEAQFHGPLKVQDIASVTFDKKPSLALRTRLKKLKIPIKIATVKKGRYAEAAGHEFHGNQWTRDKGEASSPWDQTFGEFWKSGGGVFFHGTTTAALKSIKEKGLVPQGSPGAAATWPAIQQVDIGDRAASVYLFEQDDYDQHERAALDFARTTKRLYPNAEPVVLAIRLPKKYREQVIPDEQKIGAVRLKIDKIPPEWIRVLKNPNLSDSIRTKKAEFTVLESSDAVTLFAIFFVDNGLEVLGGPGSGNRGHAGRPGKRGGSSSKRDFSAELDAARPELEKQKELAAAQANPLAHPIAAIGLEVNAPTNDYVAAYGQEFKSQALPEGVDRGQPNECYRNASLLVVERPDLTYAEGFAMKQPGGLAVVHAWGVDGDGNVVDPTLPDPENWHYFGVKYDRERYLKHLFQAKKYGVLGGDDVVAERAVFTGGLGLRADLKTLGEAVGHEFHGNQWTKGKGSSGAPRGGRLVNNELVIGEDVDHEEAETFRMFLEKIDPRDLPASKVTLQTGPVHPNHKTAYGWYKKSTNEIIIQAGRAKTPEAVLLHEAGHALDERRDLFRRVYQAYDTDAVDQMIKGSTLHKMIRYYANSESEAVAQAVSIHLGKKYGVKIPYADEFMKAFPTVMKTVGPAIDADHAFMKDRAEKVWS